MLTTHLPSIFNDFSHTKERYIYKLTQELKCICSFIPAFLRGITHFIQLKIWLVYVRVCVCWNLKTKQNGEKIRMRSLKLPLLPTHLHTFLISFIKWTIAGRKNRKKIASCIEYEAIFSSITVAIFKLLKILSGISPSILIWIHRLEK